MTAWPPAELDLVRARRRTWSAWYQGDIHTLTDLYRGGGNAATLGLWGRLRRWFMGTQASAKATDAKFHDPIARSIVNTGAHLLFGETLTVTALDATPAESEALTELLAFSDLDNVLLEAAKTAGSKGGVGLRVVWDHPAFSKPWIEEVDPSRIVLERRRGRISGTTIWTTVAQDRRRVWRHLETHRVGHIEHALYEGTEDALGQRVPLTDRNELAGIAAQVDEDSRISTGLTVSTAVYIQNRDGNDGYGEADFAGAEHLLDGLNEALTNKMRDVRQSAARVVVPHAWLSRKGLDSRGNPVTFDLQDEVFVGVNAPGEALTEPKQVQFNIRAEEFGLVEEQLRRRIYEVSGYSPATFGADIEGSSVTATEVAARWRLTVETVEAKTRAWTVAVNDIITALVGIDVMLNNTPGLHTRRIRTEFPPVVQPTLAELTALVTALSASRSASTQTRVAILHPDWDQEQIDNEVALIRADEGFVDGDFLAD